MACPWRDVLGATRKACAQTQRTSAHVPDRPWPTRHSAINGKATASTATCAQQWQPRIRPAVAQRCREKRGCDGEAMAPVATVSRHWAGRQRGGTANSASQPRKQQQRLRAVEASGDQAKGNHGRPRAAARARASDDVRPSVVIASTRPTSRDDVRTWILKHLPKLNRFD